MRWWGKRGSPEDGTPSTGSVRASAEGAVAAGGDIAVAVTGDHNQIVLAPPVRSAYWEQVRRIAPPELIDRETELAELAAFCTADSGPAYAWWRAEAWAGKTALLSWFALHPPQGVRVVPFFVTARLGAQNDVTAYVDVVLEQLAELTGEGLPAHLTPATREAHLLDLYGAATRSCARRGERLLLLLDGLDEDRGVTTGPDAHSIASLLPARPDDGMRVLVTGRLNPPLPADVPLDHPLHDPATVHTLTSSPYAQAIRTEAERELKQLTAAGGLKHDLLAFVAAAGGGLTDEDLAALTGAVPYRVSDTLRTRAGRTFGSRAGVHLLAHEELQVQAERMLGDTELDRYRARLHTWAEEWRERGWPDGTPEYLLRGYFRMVRATGDADRLVELAMDEARHDRMLEATGSDAAGLTEVRDIGEWLAQDPCVDLLTLLRLALRRTRLRDRNLGTSVTLCRAWAELGRPDKGIALAHAVPNFATRVGALAEIAWVLAASGNRPRALEVLADAEAELERDDRRDKRHFAATAAVLRTLAELGPDLHDRADRLAERMVADGTATDWLFDVLDFWAGSGRSDRAESLARSMGPRVRCSALTRLALVLEGAGECARAEALLDEALGFAVDEEAVSPVVDQLLRAGDFARAEGLVVAALGERGDDPELFGLMVTVLVRAGEPGRAEPWVTAIEDGWLRWVADAEVACALASGGRITEAEARAAGIDEEHIRADVTLAVVETLAAQGRYAEARRGAEALAGSRNTDDALIRGALTHAKGGHAREAECFVSGVEDTARNRVPPRRRAWEHAEVAGDLLRAGYASAARMVLEDVEGFLPPRPAANATEDEAFGYDSIAAWVAEQLADTGELDRAEAMLDTTFEPHRCGGAWTAILRELVESAEYERAYALIARLGSDKESGGLLRAETTLKLAETGQIARAMALAEAIEGRPHLRAAAFAATAEALAVIGEHGRAREVLDALSESLAGESEDRFWEFVMAATRCYRAWRALGDDEAALEMLRAAEEKPALGAGTTEPVVRALVETGWYDRAEELVVGKLAGQGTDILVEALVAVGEYDRAARLAGLDKGARHVSLSAAVALAPVVAPDLGRELALCLLLGEGSWLNALPVVVRLEPRAVPWIVDTLRDTR